jgi:hypothetical protein
MANRDSLGSRLFARCGPPGANGLVRRQEKTDDTSVAFGGETFLAASAFLSRSRRRGHLGPRRRLQEWPRGVWATALVLARVPRIELSLTDSPSGGAIDAFLRERRRGLRTRLLARGVLTIPPTADEYLTGRSRRAVRTNRSHAARLGIDCGDLCDSASAESAVRHLSSRGMLDNPDVRLAARGDRWLIARDPSGEAVGAVLVTIDRHWAMLTVLLGSPHAVKYALHTDLVLKLSQMGVRYLFTATESALVLPPGFQYLQRVLGYRVVNLRLRSGRRGRRLRRPG